MQRSAPRLAIRLTALSAAVLAAFAAQAAVIVTGNLGTDPASVLGPGDTVLPGTVAWVGSNGVGSLTVDNGSFLSLARVAFGAGGGTSIGTGLITGSGTQVQLAGNGTNNQTHRLTVGDWGIASSPSVLGPWFPPAATRHPACWPSTSATPSSVPPLATMPR